MEIRNISPLGDLDVTLLGREVAAGEVLTVTDEQAAQLCDGMNFEPVDAEAFAALLPEPDEPADLPVADEPPTEDAPDQPAGRKTKTEEV